MKRIAHFNPAGRMARSTTAQVPVDSRVYSRRFVLGAIGASCTLVALPTMAHSSRPLSLTRLVEQSATRVVATPLETTSKWEGEGDSRRIVSYTPLEVHYHLDERSAGATQPVVRTLGGIVGDIGQLVSTEASLLSGHPCVCFLRPSADGTMLFAGMAQGHYALSLDDLGEARLDANRAAVEQAAADPQSAVNRLRGRTLQHCERLVRQELAR